MSLALVCLFVAINTTINLGVKGIIWLIHPDRSLSVESRQDLKQEQRQEPEGKLLAGWRVSLVGQLVFLYHLGLPAWDSNTHRGLSPSTLSQ